MDILKVALSMRLFLFKRMLSGKYFPSKRKYFRKSVLFKGIFIIFAKK